MIGGSATEIFQGMDRTDAERLYRDVHFNENGTAAFTAAVIPPLLEAFDKDSHE